MVSRKLKNQLKKKRNEKRYVQRKIAQKISSKLLQKIENFKRVRDGRMEGGMILTSCGET